MPAEWESHSATWLSWPHNRDSWPSKFEKIPPVFAQVVKHLIPGEEVHINVADREMRKEARETLLRYDALSDRVHLHLIPTNDAWCRDHGPIFLIREGNERRELAAVNWRFNSWGEKYPPYDLDDLVPRRIAETLGIHCFEPDVVMEGGSLDINGLGTLLTTESCLLNPNRNPRLGKNEIEQYLMDYLGITNVLWLSTGISGDDTDGHIDDLARFVDPKTVVTVVENDPEDEDYRPLMENLRRLERMADQDGNPLTIVKLPTPPPIYHEGTRLPCSYANFYIGNEVILLPTYNCTADEVARETLQNLFPSRPVIGLDCTDLAWGLGALHCITQQQPAL